ncbi:fruit bromelain-like [Silene latifolia]|uniref:fruit bromelain-like n=1 Tax=Silene latifolia TaxID=37657 RepID=UPI003D76DBC8
MMDKFEAWIAQYGREYKSVTEKEKRFHIFEENMRLIEEFNSNNASNSYTIGSNEFTDLTTKEFEATYMGYDAYTNSSRLISSTLGNKNILVKQSVDWRQQGAVTPVKTQGGCGVCWAFAAIGALEGMYKIKTGKLVSFSEQELVDCIHGCRGGDMRAAYDYIRDHGIKTEQAYPYVGRPGRCSIGSNLVKISGYKVVPHGSINLLQALNQQPIAVGLDAGSNEFKHYSGGVYTGRCGYKINHAVTAIGYGTDNASGKNYWLIKNSWGGSWGEKGYMRILRDESVCPITFNSVYPVM